MNNKTPIKETEKKIINKREYNKLINPNIKIEVNTIKAEKDINNNVKHVIDNNTENSSTWQEYKSEGIGALLTGAAGFTVGFFLAPTVGALAAVTAGAVATGALLGKLFK